MNVEIPETPKVKENDTVVKVVNAKPSKETVSNIPKEKKEDIKKSTVLTHKQKQYLRTEKYKKKLRKNRANLSSRNCFNSHYQDNCYHLPSNFQGNQIAHSQGKRSTNSEQKGIPNQDVPNHQMKPQVPKPQKETVFKYSNHENLKISDFNEQKKMFTSLWVQSNMIFPQPKSKLEKSKQVWIPKNV